MTKTRKIDYFQVAYVLLLIFIIILIILLPKNSISSFYDGIQLWATKVLPTLLPFFILTKLLSQTPLIPYLEKKISPLTQQFYGVGGVAGYVYIMSIISGYPVGAKITSDLYESGKITKSEAQTITAFTSTSGPLFILGSVAVGMFGSAKMGAIIIVSHYLGALINGLLYRQKEPYTKTLGVVPQTNAIPLGEVVSSSVMAVLNIGGFIALFYMIISLASSLNFFSLITKPLSYLGIPQGVSRGVLSGLIEVTSGEKILSDTSLSLSLATVLSSTIISFGGLSIHAQAYSFLSKFDMPYRKFLRQKITHALFSTIISILLALIF